MFCPQLFCLIKDFVQSEEDEKAGLTRKASARKQLDAALKPMPGVSSEAIRKNKVVDCLKALFMNQDAFASPKPEYAVKEFNSEIGKVCQQVKRLIHNKKVCGKPLNAKMMLSLSLEYAETLTSY